MKKIILFLTFAALLFAGCAKVENEIVVPDPMDENGTYKVTLRASVDGSTRISADAEGNYAWQKGDVIGVLTDFDFVVSDPAQSSGTTVDFDFTLEQGDNLGGYAFYPVADVFEYRFSDDLFCLSPEYQYVKDATNMPMLGTISSSGVSFKSIGAVLKVSFSNVPTGACYLRFSAGEENISGRVFITDGLTGKEISVDNFDPECWSNQNYIDIHFWEFDDDENPVSLAETNMVFYLPLPVGTYHSFTFDFRGFDESGVGYTIISKSAQMGGSGLQVERNDIIAVPTLTLPGVAPTEPNIHDFIEFSEETLRYFPELASDNPVIRIPRKQFEMDFEWYEFSFENRDGNDDDVYGARFVDENNSPNPWLFVGWHEGRGDCIYPKYTSFALRTGKMVFENDGNQSNYPTFEVPVEEFYVPTLKKNGKPVFRNDRVLMFPGETADLTVEIPRWMTVNSHDWETHEFDGIASFSEETDVSDDYFTRYSRTLTIDQECQRGSCWFDFINELSYQHMIDVNLSGMTYTINPFIIVTPIHIYDQNENNITSSELYLNPGDELSLSTQMWSGIPNGAGYNKYWYAEYKDPDNNWVDLTQPNSILDFSYNPENPEAVTIKVKAYLGETIYVSFNLENVDDEDDYYYADFNIHIEYDD